MEQLGQHIMVGSLRSSLVERKSLKLLVAGSNPVEATIKSERLSRYVVKGA